MAWAKGVSGNPNGRPKLGKTITDAIKKELAKRKLIWDEDLQRFRSITKKEAFAKVVVKKALDGEDTAIKEILNHVDGLPLAKHEIMGPEGGPVSFKYEPKLDDKNEDAD